MNQYYETTILDDDSHLKCTILTIPSRCYIKYDKERVAGNNLDVIDKLISVLELKQLRKIERGWLTRSLSLIFAIADHDEHEFKKSNLGLDSVCPRQEHYRFSEYLLMSRCVPFENSPLSAQNLGEILTTATGVGAGAYAGFMVAGN